MNNPFFPEIHGKFGFGCMRLPEANGEIDLEHFSNMVDCFLQAGLNYFDTAHVYHGGKSEPALKAALTSRHPREAFLLADKLSGSTFETEADIRPLFAKQLELLGVEYLDFYLMHAQNARNFEKYKACRAYETALALKAEGKIRHVGLSFHDSAEVLDRILTEYPQMEFVQIQFNYLDDGDPAVDSRRVYETCVKHNKPVIVMEPIKGGTLVKLPEEDAARYAALGKSPAEMALRFAAGFPQMTMVLSGMSSLEQLKENVGFMAEAAPLNREELAAIDRTRESFRKLNLIPCTGCRYCTDGCPMEIRIPDMFACLNRMKQFNDWNQIRYYRQILTGEGRSPASACLQCGMCEASCPQNLPIRDLLVQVAETFEKKQEA